MAGYSPHSVSRKLGIGADAEVLLDGAPDGFSLDDMPAGARLSQRPDGGPYQVILCFCPDRARMEARWPALHPLTSPAGALWIAWPKRSSGVTTDLTENIVRDHALTNGRVDVKVCAIDDVWSALKNVIRKADR